jgi:hypothetical protein
VFVATAVPRCQNASPKRRGKGRGLAVDLELQAEARLCTIVFNLAKTIRLKPLLA